MVPLLWFLFRNRPEDVGQSPDGVRARVRRPHLTLAAHEQTSFALREAMRTRAYWIMFLSQGTWALIGTALVFNIQSLFVSRGLTSTCADRSLGVLFVAIAAMQLAGGILADRIPLNALATFSVAGLTSGIAILLFANPVWTSVGYVVFGLAHGLLAACVNTIWPRYFGRAHVGKIRGSVMSAAVAGSSLGPFVMGFSFDAFGSYVPSLWLFGGMLSVLIFATMFATPPCRETPDVNTRFVAVAEARRDEGQAACV